MLDELKHYNSIGDVNGITYLLKLFLSDSGIQKESANNLCSLRRGMRLNFNAAVLMFKYLDIIEEKDIYLYLTEFGKGLALATNVEEALCKLCFEKTIADHLLDVSAVHYNVCGDRYAIAKYGFCVSAALFRNILIQYHALEEFSGDLLIASEYESIFIEYQRKHKFQKSLETLKKQLENQELQGAKAEEFIMRYEARRLAGHSKVKKIRQISVVDVTAGYDILSFKNEESPEYDLFIEVKSYYGNLHFYWSKNEIEAAKLYEERYCIYLVDVSKLDDPAYEPLIIENPANNVLGSDLWIVNPMSYLVIPTE